MGPCLESGPCQRCNASTQRGQHQAGLREAQGCPGAVSERQRAAGTADVQPFGRRAREINGGVASRPAVAGAKRGQAGTGGRTGAPSRRDTAVGRPWRRPSAEKSGNGCRASSTPRSLQRAWMAPKSTPQCTMSLSCAQTTEQRTLGNRGCAWLPSAPAQHTCTRRGKYVHHEQLRLLWHTRRRALLAGVPAAASGAHACCEFRMQVTPSSSSSLSTSAGVCGWVPARAPGYTTRGQRGKIGESLKSREAARKRVL